MNPHEMVGILRQAAKLKTNTRHCQTAPGRMESVADHSWRIALMAMLLRGEPEFDGVDLDKVVRMCLIHDLGESFTGDIPVFQKTDENTHTEDALFAQWVRGFSEPQRTQWLEMLGEMQAQQTTEARIYKALDKMEAVLAHDESDLSTWLELEYTLQREYGFDAVRFSPYLTALRAEIDDLTVQKIREGK